ncbi:MAG: hypothetical protein MI923_21855, partial [Phycisphaerales bacterium]|nr:hypothetical protein [Phycisphaerales bacterium]
MIKTLEPKNQFSGNPFRFLFARNGDASFSRFAATLITFQLILVTTAIYEGAFIIEGPNVGFGEDIFHVALIAVLLMGLYAVRA